MKNGCLYIINYLFVVNLFLKSSIGRSVAVSVSTGATYRTVGYFKNGAVLAAPYPLGAAFGCLLG